MSSTPKGPRRHLDRYNTDPRVALAICRRLADEGAIFDGAVILEPHVGFGVFVYAIRQVMLERGWRCDLYINDIDPDAPGLLLQSGSYQSNWDFLEWAPEIDTVFDLVVGNPPFANVPEGRKRGPVVAHKHILAATRLAPWVCVISRVGLLTTSADRRFALDHPPAHRFDLWPRPSFDVEKGGTDSCEYLAGLWGQRRPVTTTAEILDWRHHGAWPGVNPEMKTAEHWKAWCAVYVRAA